MVRAARATKRILQIGVQQRSGTPYLESRELFLQSGKLGRVTHIDAILHGGPGGAGRPQLITEKPDNLDWIRFLGNVRYRDWNAAQYLNFRAFLDFNGGKMTDFGYHWLDAVHMYMGDRAPSSVA